MNEKDEIKLVDVENLTDEELIEEVKNGDITAFNTIVRRYKNKLYSTLYRIMKDHEASEEILQETFIRVYRHRNGYKSTYRFSTWIYTIALNLMRGYMRKNKPLVSLEEVNPNALLNDPPTSPDEELKIRLERAIETLPVHYKTAFLLREVDRFTYEEIAKVMKCRIGTAKSRVNRARGMLKEKLGKFFARER